MPFRSIVSDEVGTPHEGVRWFREFKDAAAIFPDAVVIGGGETYRQAMRSGLVKNFFITRVDDTSKDGTYFPFGALLDQFIVILYSFL